MYGIHICMGYIHVWDTCMYGIHIGRYWIHICMGYVHICMGYVHICRYWIHICMGYIFLPCMPDLVI
jgi:hypothetical protein